MQPDMIEAKRALGEVLHNPSTATAEGTLQLIGLLRHSTRLLEHRYAVQISERHDPAPVPAFLKKANGQAEPKNKGGRPRGTGRKQKAAAAAQPVMFPSEPAASDTPAAA